MHHRPLAAIAAAALVVSACSGDDDATPAPSTGGGATPTTVAGPAPSTPGSEPAIDPERCATNEAVGTITYASSYDFAASASILEVVVADAKGYFDELCLDVELVPGFSSTNYPLIEAGEAHFSSAGNYTEILKYTAQGGEFVAVTNAGKTAVEALAVPADGATTIEELAGRTIGVKGDIPTSLVAMLATHGLVRGEDYREILLEGFDPTVQLPQVDALPVYKSAEPGQLEAAGIEHRLFDPGADGIPGTFGILYTSKSFAESHPTVVEDFVRAALKGLEDALDDPAAAAEIAVAKINATGNAYYLTLDSELYRWTREAEIITASTPDGDPVGLIDGDLFQAEYDFYVAAGAFPNGAPAWAPAFDPGPAAAAYGPDGRVRWP